MEWYVWIPYILFGCMWLIATVMAVWFFYVEVYQKRELLVPIVMGLGWFVSIPMMLVGYLIPATDKALSRAIVKIIERSFRNAGK